MQPILRMHDQAGPAELGGKGWALARARRAGLPVPDWFALSPAACGTQWREELAGALAELCPRGETVAVRSSALDEDGAVLSFAGQLESYLFVPHVQVANRAADVWRSASAARVRAYRAQHGKCTHASLPAVLVQRMIDADVAGVAFSADPVSGRRALAVVAAARGIGAGVVSGERDADSYYVSRDGAVVSRKTVGAAPCLSDAQAAEVAALARRCARHFGAPQDIEWAIAGECLWLLQSRPITSLAGLPDPDGELAIWDSSNIAESYGGVTTPMTFSFIRRCYEHAYREFNRLGGVPEEEIRANDDAYRRMLGFVRGRVYYNLLSWYRLLALIPGFRHNRQFLDEMLGVRERPELAVLAPMQGRARRAALARQAARMVIHFATVERTNRRFKRRLDAALAAPPVALGEMRVDELVAYYRWLERKLLKRWDAPLLNDFFAMIFHGLLRRLVARWLGPRDAGLDNHLLSGESGIVSVEPVRRVREMARAAAAEAGLPDLLRSGCASAALERLGQCPRLHQLYLDYLERFAERCPEELKLESIPLDQDPLPLLRAVGHLAGATMVAEEGGGSSLRRAAEARVASALRARPLRRAVFSWVLRNARARVRDRENLRFERTRLFGRVRAIVVELGKRLHTLGVLEAPRDVFHLELEELLGFVDGAATCTDLRGLCALRKAELERHRGAVAPPRRFETRSLGQVELGLVALPRSGPCQGGEERAGTGCSPGVVRGRARVVAAAEGARVLPGEILVAERTDPGWVMLFASAAGLVVERGNLLSHAAIVAREMALPAVVGLADACGWLRDGDLVELDGATGSVRRLECAR
ncbi:MAG: PEP-utilizing enzyme [Betaproteobacteria bacterium]|nr:PEP-utilizing enzyme [Betaproteobacteria bacterium]